MNKVYVVSGYFAEIPVVGGLHSGHMKYISEVLTRMDESDRLVIIVNNESQRLKKYSNLEGLPTDNKIKLFGVSTNSWIIAKLQELYPYDNVRVMISKSEDQTVCQDLETLAWFFADRKTVIFVKDGGEYDIENLPERKVKGIDFLFLQNPKVDSASEILLKER
jgi:hypothetical protein